MTEFEPISILPLYHSGVMAVKGRCGMYFDTPNGPVYEPENQILRPFFNTLKELAPTLAGSPAFERLVDVYEALEFDMREEQTNESAASA